MASLKWTGWCGIAGAATVLALGILPSTRWVTRLHASVVLGGLHKTNPFIDTTNYYATILRSGLPEHPTTMRDELLKAILTQDGDERRAAMHELSDKYPKDALVQSEMGRYATMMGVRAPSSQAKSATRLNKSQAHEEAADEEKRIRIARWLATAAARGEAVDPDNAQFSILSAAASFSLGNERRARQDLLKAADKNGFQDYSWEEADLLTAPLRGKLFSSNYAILQAEASIVLPYYAHYKYLTRVFAHWGTPREQIEARIKVLKLADTVGRRADILIAMLVAASCAKICVVPESVVPDAFSHVSPEKYTDGDYLEWARQLQAQAVTDHVDIAGFDPVASLRSQLAVIRAAHDLGGDQGSDFPMDFPFSTLFGLEWSGVLLLSMILLFPAAGLFMVGQMLRQSDGGAAALPLLPPLLAIGVFAESLADVWTLGVVILLVLGLISAFVPRYRPAMKYLVLGAILLGGVSGIPTGGTSLACFAAVVLAVTWTFSHVWNFDWSVWLVSVVQVVGLSVWSAVLLMVNNGWGAPLRHLLVPLCVLLLCATFGPRRRLPIFAMVGPALLLMAIAYGLGVRRVVTIDRQSLAVLASVKNEVSDVRHLSQSIWGK